MWDNFKGVLFGMILFGSVAYAMESETDSATVSAKPEKPSVVVSVMNAFKAKSASHDRSLDI